MATDALNERPHHAFQCFQVLRFIHDLQQVGIEAGMQPIEVILWQPGTIPGPLGNIVVLQDQNVGNGINIDTIRHTSPYPSPDRDMTDTDASGKFCARHTRGLNLTP